MLARLLAPLLLLMLLAPAASAATPSDAQAPIDQLMEAQLKKHKIPGAVFVMVKDGQVLYSKGYGLANIERAMQADPERTLFAMGSITKLFTGTAAMQLAEQGKLDLQADVNRYLTELQVPAAYPQPVTMHHLLTHTAGFDESEIGMVARIRQQQRPIGQALAAGLPERIRPPGEVFQYSNHGMALAGHVVERIAGVPYERYVAERIFQPLGMSRSTLALEEDRFPDRAMGYQYRAGRQVPQPVWHLELAPAGSLWSTGTDMARFMIAQLQQGEYAGQRILQPATAREMQRRQFGFAPQISGVAYAFMDLPRGGQRVLYHGGGLAGFTSRLLLAPAANWGYLVAYNSGGVEAAAFELKKELLKQYFPRGPEPAAPQAAQAPPEPQRFVGTYITNRYDRTTFAKLNIFGSVLRVKTDTDGTLLLMQGRGPVRLIPAGPLLFRQEDVPLYIGFREDEEGRITHLLGDDGVMERAPWYGSFPLQAGLIGFGSVMALSWPGAALIRRRPAPSPGLRWARWTMAAVCGLLLLFLAGLGYIGWTQLELVFGLSPLVRAILALPLLLTALTVPLLWHAVKAWRGGHFTLAGRIHYSLVTLAMLGLPLFFWYWNLLRLPL